MSEQVHAPIELWPEGAPYAEGTGDEDRPAITPYLAEGGRGAVIVCPGGGYHHRAPYEGDPVALWLNSLGVSAFVLRYRVAPYSYPCALKDVQRAVRYVRAHAAEWGFDGEKVGVLGFSAGGHLTASAGTHYDRGDEEASDPIERFSCRPDLIMLCYPVITMDEAYTHAGSRNYLLGEQPPQELVDLMSCEKQVTPDTPPSFIWHTSGDGAVPVENALMFAAALSKAQVPFDLHVFEKGRHGMAMAEEDPHTAAWTALCASWLKKYNYY